MSELLSEHLEGDIFAEQRHQQAQFSQSDHDLTLEEQGFMRASRANRA